MNTWFGDFTLGPEDIFARRLQTVEPDQKAERRKKYKARKKTEPSKRAATLPKTRGPRRRKHR